MRDHSILQVYNKIFLMLNFTLTFFVGGIAAVIGAMVGGGGLISIPLLIFLGLPPQVAIATNKFGSAGLTIGAVIKFWKSGHILWSYILPLTLVSGIAAFIGSHILLAVNKEFLQSMVGVVLLVILPFVIFKKKTGMEHQSVSTLRRGIGYVLYFFVEIYGAFFGAGAATFKYYVLMTCFGTTIIEASAVSKIPSFTMTMVSLVIFAYSGILDYRYGAALFLGMLVGGWIGAHIAIKKGNAWVKVFFGIIVLVSAVKLFVSR